MEQVRKYNQIKIGKVVTARIAVIVALMLVFQMLFLYLADTEHPETAVVNNSNQLPALEMQVASRAENEPQTGSSFLQVE